jgi:PEP-CTERM motif
MNALMKQFAIAAAAVGLTLGSAGLSLAAPIVTETVSGTSGNYTLDFSVQNNLGNTNDIYFFGVLIDSGRDIVGSPTGFNPNTWPSWSNSAYGGSNLVYNNNWIDFTYSHLPNGSTLGGFSVHTTDAVAPTSVHWFAYAYEGTYYGSDHFNSSTNPGFEGVTRSAVPEPSTLVMAGLATVIGLGYQWRRRRAAL